MFFGFEFINGKIIDTDQPDPALDQELRSFRLEIDEVFVEFSVLPVFGVLGLEENPLDSIPLQILQIFSSNGSNTRQVHDRCLTGQLFQWYFVQAPSPFNKMVRRVEVGAGMRAHLNGSQPNGVTFVSR